MIKVEEINIQQPFECHNDIKLYPCNECTGFQLDTWTQVKHHVRENHSFERLKEQKLKCENCNFSTHSRYIFLRHRLFDNCDKIKSENYLQCKICDYQSFYYNNLTTHITLNHLKFPESRHYRCEYCPAKYNAEQSLDHHVKFKHTNVEINLRFECEQCGYKTRYRHLLKNHYLIKHPKDDIKRFECELCSSKFANKTYLVSHMYCVHDKSAKVRRFQCQFCGYKARWNCELQEHINTKHTSNDKILWVYCTLCPSKFKLERYLKKHIRFVHNNVKVKKRHYHLKCEHCTYTASCHRDLNVHMLSKHVPEDQINWFRCDLCPSKFIAKRYLRQHMFRHKPKEVGYKCEQCLYIARYPSELKSHIEAKHTSIDKQLNLFSCDKCGKKYREKRNFKSHLLQCNVKFEDIPWLQCEDCKYKTVQEDALKKHRYRNHSDDIEWFQCDSCNFKTKYKRSLKSHRMKKHGLKVLQCELCVFNTTDKEVFIEHLKIHNITALHCLYCLSVYKTKRALQDHFRRKHKDVELFGCENCDFKSNIKRGLFQHRKKCKKTNVGENVDEQPSEVE